MLHVVCMILKILLFILLGILGCLLLLCLLVLFCPIRYQAETSYHGKKSVYVLAKIRYLIVSFRILYNQKSGDVRQEIRILGIRIGKKHKKKTKDITEEENEYLDFDEEEDIEESQNKTGQTQEWEVGETESERAQEWEAGETESERVQEWEAGETESERVQEWEAGETESECAQEFEEVVEANIDCEQESRISNDDEKTSVHSHTLEKTISAWWTRLEVKKKEVTRKRKRLKKFWNLSCTEKTRAYLKKYIPKTMRHIIPRNVTGVVTYGMEDPCTTGQITGYISLLPFVYQKHLTIQPDFSRKIFEMDIRLKGHITLGYLLRIVLNVNIWRTIKVARKIIKSQ